jgi:EmrB/QacA subfamily drug resistance transporter
VTPVDPTLREDRSESAVMATWIVPAIIGSAMLMQTLSATVIANALPTMAHALDVEPLRLNLAITAYLLASAVFLPISGWAADRFGAKRVFVIAMVLYAASSASCGFAVNLWQLVLARFCQGAAGALMTPVGRLVLLRTTPKSELVGAMSVLTIPALVGPVIGPVLGGFIVTFWDWRWIFFINLPIAAVGVALVLRFVPNVQELETQRLDWVGVLLTGVGLAAVIFGFENLAQSTLPRPAVYGLLALGVTCLALYVRHAKDNPNAILDLSLFRLNTFNASVVGGGFLRLAMGAMPFMLAMLLQIGFGMSPFQAGMMTFVSAAGALVMKTTAPPILRRFGFRAVLVVNSLITGAFFMAYGFFQLSTPHWLIMTALLLGGFFRSLQFTSLTGLAYAEIEQPQMSRASTLSSMGQSVLQSFGIGLAAMLMHTLARTVGDGRITVASVAPAFFILGAVSMVSLLFFLRLPRDAGDDMNGR